MHLNTDGWLDIAEPLASPHHNDRPDADDISLLVIHNISLPPQEYGDRYISALFLGTLPAQRHEHPYLDEIADLRVAAHFLILRDGHIKQYVPTTARAWHAGISTYEGRENCNDFSIGIELNGSITGHSDIAPTRKTDPGAAFNWPYYRRLLARQTTP